MRNVLVLSSWFPFPPDNGSRLRAFHLIRELSRRHTIRLVTGVQADQSRPSDAVPPELAALCDEVVAVPWQWYRPGRGGALGAWRSLLSLTPRSIEETRNPPLAAAVAAQMRHPTDAVLALELGMAPFVPAAGPGTTPPVVLDQVEFSALDQAYQSARGRARWRHGLTRSKARRYWRRALRRFDRITAVSAEEAVVVRGVLGAETGAPPVCVVPNGVAVAAYRRTPGRAVPGRLLYNGALTYAPNREAVRWFLRAVMPRVAERVSDAHLVVTGRYDGLEIGDLRDDSRCRLTGYVDDLRPVLDEATLCVVPLQTGGGTRLKILEAFAAELPVVSTTVGAAGLDVRDGEHLVLADTPEALADAVVALLQQPERAASLARQARCLVETQYDWSAIANRLSDLLCEAAAEKRTTV